MWKKVSILICLTLALLGAESEIRIENSNFTLSQAGLPTELTGVEDKRYVYNYDRLRFEGTLKEEGYYMTAIVDAVNYVGASYIQSPEFIYLKEVKPDIPFDSQSHLYDYGDGAAYAKIHRLYAGYADEKHHIVAGIQNIPMGVGHIWTPTDLYNPKNAYALEPDEVFGVLALSYSYAPSPLSSVQVIVSQKRDKSAKFGFRYKTFLDFADVGVSFIRTDVLKMAGYEIEGDVFDTGVQWRSEGAYYQSDLLDEDFYQIIAGFDYAFTWGLNWTVEGYYSSETFGYAQKLAHSGDELFSVMVQSKKYIGMTLGYDFDLAWSGSLLWIESMESPRSRFIAPSITYTVNDRHALIAGGMFYAGGARSEWGEFGSSFYLNWKWNF